MSVPTAAVKLGDSVQNALDSFFGFLPNLLGFLIILIVGYVIARIVKGIITKLLQKAGLDKALHSGHSGQYVEKLSPGASPAKLIGSVVFWLIFVFVLSAAIGALKIPAVTAFMNQVLAYLPNVIAAIVIFVIAGAVAGAVGALVVKTMGDTPTGKIIGTAVPALVMGIALFMVLNQLHIAPQIVTITYAALLGAVALGGALAFGLGGRDVARRMLEDAYSKGQDQKDQVKQDVQTGKQRGQEQAETQRNRLEGGGGSSSGAGSVRSDRR
jgi:uncharacterized membrane protein YgcG